MRKKDLWENWCLRRERKKYFMLSTQLGEIEEIRNEASKKREE